MKSTDNFKKVIESHLQSVAEKDPLFAETLKKENKNIDDCITFILNNVKASGCNGFTDDEIFGMAIHYYDEDDIKVGKPISGNVVVNHKVELSAEEIQRAKDEAKERVIAEEREKIVAKKPSKKKVDNPDVQPSIFD